MGASPVEPDTVGDRLPERIIRLKEKLLACIRTRLAQQLFAEPAHHGRGDPGGRLRADHRDDPDHRAGAADPRRN